MRGDIIDLSGRYFKNITGFQYAVWSGDEEMWNIFLEFLTEVEAYEQLNELLKERPDIAKEHGEPLSFLDTLLTAYKFYIDNFDNWRDDQLEAYWCKQVGDAQQKMPAWFIYMFSDHPLDETLYAQQPKRGFNRRSEHDLPPKNALTLK